MIKFLGAFFIFLGFDEGLKIDETAEKITDIDWQLLYLPLISRRGNRLAHDLVAQPRPAATTLAHRCGSLGGLPATRGLSVGLVVDSRRSHRFLLLSHGDRGNARDAWLDFLHSRPVQDQLAKRPYASPPARESEGAASSYAAIGAPLPTRIEVLRIGSNIRPAR